MIERFVGFPSRGSRRVLKSRRTSRLRTFECLESRKLLAYSADFDAATGVLTFTGDGSNAGEAVRLSMQGGASAETISAAWNDDVAGPTTQTFSGVTTVFVQNVIDDNDRIEVLGLSGATISLADSTVEYNGLLFVYTTNMANVTLDAGGGVDAGNVTLAGEAFDGVVVQNAGAVTIGAGASFTVGTLDVVANSIDIADQVVSTGIVDLTATAGAITAASAASVIEGTTATLAAATGINVFTQLASLSATVTGTGDVQITEVDGSVADGLTVLAASTADGSISLEAQTGDLTVQGNVAASSGLTAAENSVSLVAKAGSIAGGGTIKSSLLDVNASGAATVTTTIGSVQAVVGQSLSVTETDALQIGTQGISAGGRVSLTTGAAVTKPGGLTGGFPVVAPELVLKNLSTVAATGSQPGSIALTSPLNNVGRLSARNASPTGAVSFQNQGDLIIGIDGTGISTVNGSIIIGDGPITVVDPLVFGTGGLQLSGDLTFIVSSAADSGDRTLRTVLGYAVANSPQSTALSAANIEFDDAVSLITVSSVPMPIITVPVAIDGGDARVELRAAGTTSSTSGLRFGAGSDNSRVRGMIIGGFTGAAAIELRGTGASVTDCWLGIDRAGVARGNLHGVLVSGGLAASNAIGGADVADRNVIAGNTSDGIRIDIGASATVVSGNWVGLNAGGTVLANGGAGVRVTGSSFTVINGGNVISGNIGDGVVIDGAASTTITGNLIGTNVSGDAAVANRGSGVVVRGAVSTGSTIGTAEDGGQNVISGNTGRGILLTAGATGISITGNLVGLSSDGSKAVGNAAAGIRIDAASKNTIGAGNVISGNVGNGIEIVGSSDGNTVTQVLVGTDVEGATAVANGGSGIRVEGGAANIVGSGSTISGNTKYGVEITGGATDTRLVGAYVGLDKSGVNAIANRLGGVRVDGVGTDGTFIGGTDPNVISGNDAAGVVIGVGATETTLDSNFIGLDAAGANAVPNKGNGISVDGGGLVTLLSNVVSGNKGDGVFVRGAAASGSIITGNSVGVDALGEMAIGNTGVGIRLVSTSKITVGGLSKGQSNLISGNDDSGVVIGGSGSLEGSSDVQVLGNIVGLDAEGLLPVGNKVHGVLLQGALTVGATIQENTISGNGKSGISLSGGAGQTTIASNRVGTTLAGASAVGNGASGISISGGTGNTIGGGTSAMANIVSGNLLAGIELLAGATLNQVSFNRVGVDAIGSAGLGNGGDGILVEDSPANTIALNVVSGNSANGIAVTKNGSTAITIRGNFVGTDVTGTKAIANGLAGVEVNGAAGVLIGGASDPDRNVISGNAGDGVVAIAADAVEIRRNVIGLMANGVGRLGNQANGIVLRQATGTIIGDRNRVAFNGTMGSAGGHGIVIDEGSSETLVGSLTTAAGGNLIYANALDGVRIAGGSQQNVVLANSIGTTEALGLGLGNGGSGISIQASNGNTIGANLPATPSGVMLGNVILGNRDGVTVSDAQAESPDVGNAIIGNRIQSNKRFGVHVTGSSNQTIGGQSDEAANTVTLSGDVGVLISAGSTGVSVLGNFIGTNASQAAHLGNKAAGIEIRDSVGNTVGGTAAVLGNRVIGNAVGISLTGMPTDATSGNSLLGNVLRGNTSQGIRVFNSSFNMIGPEAGPGANTIVASGGDGVAVLGSSEGNRIQSNLIGVDATGSVAPNQGDGVELNGVGENVVRTNSIRGNVGAGVRVVGGSGTVIGGAATGDANSVLGNRLDGIVIEANATDIAVQGNRVDANGGSGVSVRGSSSNRINANTIIRNVGSGVVVSASSQRNEILGNSIGVDSTSSTKLGNLSYGIVVDRSQANTVEDNTISRNMAAGVLVSNVMAATPDLGNSVSGNVVQANRGAGIRLEASANTMVDGNTIGGPTAFGLGNLTGIEVAARSSASVIMTNRIEGSGRAGISVAGSEGTVVGGGSSAEGNEIIGNKGNGIELTGSSFSNTVSWNYVGSLRDGLGRRGNAGNGIAIMGAVGNVVDANAVFDNAQAGVAITGSLAANIASGNVVVSNTVIGNASGVSIVGSRWQTVGTDESPNYLSANRGAGVSVAGNSSGTSVVGNIVTVNGRDGILISGSTATIVSGNQISSNKASGVNIDAAVSLSAATANRVLSNTISANGAAGVTLGSKTQFAEIGGLGAGNTIVLNATSGINVLAGANGNRVIANSIGVDAGGTAGLGNKGDGIRITTAFGNVISDGNTIANNAGSGVRIVSSEAVTLARANVVSGSVIVGNRQGGVFVASGGIQRIIDNVIAGNTGRGITVDALPAASQKSGAVISGNEITSNSGEGIFVNGAGASTIASNRIGTNVGGDNLANGGNGIRLVGSKGNTIGGVAAERGNVIQFNKGSGIRLEGLSTGNFLWSNTVASNAGDGVTLAGKSVTSNVIGVQGTGSRPVGSGNSIYGNALAAVRIDGGVRNQVFANRMFDNPLGIVLANGGNSIQAAPVLATAAMVTVTGRQQLQITGSVRGAARQKIVLEFFSNPSGATPVQGATPLGRATITTGTNGVGTFSILLDADADVGDLLTATATTVSGVIGNTSAISTGVQIDVG
jgi:parallel beta-helix repeat protein